MSRVVKVLWAAAKRRRDSSQEAAQARAWAEAQGGGGKAPQLRHCPWMPSLVLGCMCQACPDAACAALAVTGACVMHSSQACPISTEQ